MPFCYLRDTLGDCGSSRNDVGVWSRHFVDLGTIWEPFRKLLGTEDENYVCVCWARFQVTFCINFRVQIGILGTPEQGSRMEGLQKKTVDGN